MKTTNQPNQLHVFAVTAPGLERICANELSALGIRGEVQDGGVAWTGALDSVARANLWLRTASRVIVRVAEFRATAFYELERHAKRIAWSRFITANSNVEFRVTCRKSKLYHSDAVAQRFIEWVGPTRSRSAAPPSDDDETLNGRQLFIVRIFRDVCTVSVDTSGALLHLRGYRQQLAKAPLRETLAAATLLGAGWKGDIPFDDPMCGSGTIPIEAALIARRIAPGIARASNRAFAFFNWPETDERAFQSMIDQARATELTRSPVDIHGADRDAGAITAARANADRAGVSNDVQFDEQPISAMSSQPAPGLIASNPPYGVRVGETDRLRNLYAQFGNVVRRNRSGWTVALLGADTRLEQQTQLGFDEVFRTTNGGIPVHLITAPVP